MLAPLIYSDSTAIVPAAVRNSWAQRQYLRTLLKRLDVDCVIDVGANVGGFGNELRAIGYKGSIVSFEPDPDSYKKLHANASEDPDWTPVNMALGRASGQAEFNIMAQSVFNSFLNPTKTEANNAGHGNRIKSRIVVPVHTADEVLPELLDRHKSRRPYLKMDTQGYDLEVFRGARTIRESLVGMQSELSIKPLYEGAPAWREALAEYEDGGFELSAIYAVHPEAPELVDVDCHLVRRSAAV
jgi:FkbM family methyltransferase